MFSRNFSQGSCFCWHQLGEGTGHYVHAAAVTAPLLIDGHCVAIDELRLRVAFEVGDDGGNGVGRVEVVRVQPCKDFAFCQSEPFVDGMSLTGIRFGDITQEVLVSPQDIERTIRRTSVYDQMPMFALRFDF